MGHKIDYKTASGSEEAYSKVKLLISSPEYAQKFQVKADHVFDDEKKIIRSTGAGFKLTLCFFDKYCDADLDLSFLLKALKPKILGKIEDQISKNL
ncbi:MAG: hypothetical protein WC635_15040 [Bacteriovorax sp.]|jgi:hypothetical protein